MEYYTNFRPQKKLGGMTPISYRNAYNIVLKKLLYYVYLNCTPLSSHSKPSLIFSGYPPIKKAMASLPCHRLFLLLRRIYLLS
ncbi:hypothetical protein [Sedimentibacter sp. zth1]|uniref:hypothetical protein n=1 Tax=Sedimentibacter sp. zth1 TaxID=2816908 RepID=UPI00353009DE